MLPISGLPLNTYYLRVCWSNEQQYDGIREVRDYRHFTQQMFYSPENATTEMASTTAKTITKANERITQYSIDLNLRRVHRNHILTTKSLSGAYCGW